MEWLSDVVLLSRIQFAFTIMFHYLYPPLTIGLGVMLVFMEGMFLWTKNPVYESMTKFWVKIFALNFGLGVATGIVMEFEFGTNWATYSRFVGDVFGSALAAEGIFAFFLESGFLAILVFGWDKVSPRVHFLSTILVALGSMFSAVWIVIANSWQQTPAGFHIVDQAGNVLTDFVYNPLAEGIQPRAEITDFWAMVFNPSSMVRLLHSIVGGFILASFFVMSVTGYYLLKGRHLDFARRAFTIALIFGAMSSLGQLALGHWHANVVAEHQPAKLAAYEGIFETGESTPLYLFGIPNYEEKKVTGLAIPGMLSFLVHEDFKTPVTGFDQIDPEYHPPVQIPFQAYHLMISLGMYFIAITLFGCFLLWRGKLFSQRWLLWVFVFSVPLPYAANQLGWIAAEVGRQPWVVYGLLKTEHGVSKAVGAQSVLASLIMFTLIYLLLFAMFLYLLDKKIRTGPEDVEPMPDETDTEGLREAMTARGPGRSHLADSKEDLD